MSFEGGSSSQWFDRWPLEFLVGMVWTWQVEWELLGLFEVKVPLL